LQSREKKEEGGRGRDLFEEVLKRDRGLLFLCVLSDYCWEVVPRRGWRLATDFALKAFSSGMPGASREAQAHSSGKLVLSI
jgi:hypothetical protein